MAVKPFVSICIPTYNGQAFLKDCLDSCLAQTYDDYEIVVCDDGSSDASWQILQAYVREYSKLRLFKNEQNLGLVGNWNRCIENARGEWIKFVFQDDFISPDCLEKFVEAAEPGVQLLVCERNFILPADASAEQTHYYTQGVRTLRNTCEHEGNDYSPELLSKIAVANMAMNFIGEPSLSMFRKKVIAEIGPFNSHLKQICDLEFLLRLGSQRGLRYIPEKLCGFRIHAGSTTSQNIGSKYYELRYIETLLFSYFLLFDPHFEAFRTQLSWLQRIKLKTYFRVKAYNAYRVGKEQGHSSEVFKQNGPFPRIYRLRKGNLITRFIAWFKP